MHATKNRNVGIYRDVRYPPGPKLWSAESYGNLATLWFCRSYYVGQLPNLKFRFLVIRQLYAEGEEKYSLIIPINGDPLIRNSC